MSREEEQRPLSYSARAIWAVSNWGIIQKVFRSRRDALEHVRSSAAENGYTRETWRKLYEIRKMRLVPWSKP